VLFWTVVGSAASVVGVVVAVAVVVRQSRAAEKSFPGMTVLGGRSSPEKRDDQVHLAPLTSLRAPTGHLPEYVRGRDELLAQLWALVERPDGKVHVLAGLGVSARARWRLGSLERRFVWGSPHGGFRLAPIRLWRHACLDWPRCWARYLVMRQRLFLVSGILKYSALSPCQITSHSPQDRTHCSKTAQIRGYASGPQTVSAARWSTRRLSGLAYYDIGERTTSSRQKSACTKASDVCGH